MPGSDLPEVLRHLPVCPRRGLPIPYSTARAPDGTGRFGGNDVLTKVLCGVERLCGICGRRLDGEVVFLGPAHRDVRLDRVVFTDAAVHEACAEASLIVCPHIAGQRVPRRPGLGMAEPAGFDRSKPKVGWLILVTASYRMVRQPARSGGTVIAFKPGELIRIRRFCYDGGVLRETPVGAVSDDGRR